MDKKLYAAAVRKDIVQDEPSRAAGKPLGELIAVKDSI